MEDKTAAGAFGHTTNYGRDGHLKIQCDQVAGAGPTGA